MRPSKPRTTKAIGARAAVMALVALGFLGVRALPAAAAPGDVPWAVNTASNDFGSGRPNYSYTLNPGDQLEDGLVVANLGATPLNLAVYAADAFTTKGGQLDLVTKDAKSTGVGAWIHADRNDVTIRPGESVEVKFTVALPDNAAPGDYMGGIVTSLTQTSTAGKNVDRRLGIRVHLRVGGELKPRLSVENLHMRYSGTPNPFGTGDATITYTIRNTGNAIVTARQAVSISGLFGISGVRSDQIEDSPQLLPGDSWQVSVPVHGVAPALRLAERVTVVPLLTDASGSIAPLAHVETTTHTWTIPWTLLLLFVVVCGLVAVIARSVWRCHRQSKLDKDPNVGGAVEQASRELETSDQ